MQGFHQEEIQTSANQSKLNLTCVKTTAIRTIIKSSLNSVTKLYQDQMKTGRVYGLRLKN